MKEILPIATTAALAIFAGQAAAAVLGAKQGTISGIAITIAGGMAGVYAASKLVK